MKTKIFLFAFIAQLISITASAHYVEIESFEFPLMESSFINEDVDNEQNNMVVTLTVERYCGFGYQFSDASINLEELKSFLGVEEITEDMLSIVNPNGSEVFDYAPYDGWFNAEGAAEYWGENTAINVKFFQILSDGKYTICDMNGVDKVGKEYTATWKVTNGEKSVKYYIIVKFVEMSLTDVTDFFINNAHFTNDIPLDGGVCTYDYDITTHQDKGALYFGMQPVDSWTDSNPNENDHASGIFAVGSPETIWVGGPGYTAPKKKANGNTVGNIFGFLSVWSASSSYTQNVTLPAGTYTITIPTYNGGGTGTIAKNLCGFITADGDEYLAQTTSFPVGEWKEETIRFTLEEETSGVISIGYQAANAGSGSMPHLWIDEFQLKFSGVIEIKPSLIALQHAVRSAESFTSFEDGQFEATLKTQVKETLATATALVNSYSEDDNTNIAALNALNNIVSEACASRASYATFSNFIEGQLANAIKQYSGDSNFADLLNTLEKLEETYNRAYEYGEYTAKQVNEVISALPATIKEAVQTIFEQVVASGKKLTKPLDITALFEEMEMPYTTSQAIYAGEIWKDETATNNFRTNYSTAEVWNSSPFNIYRELTDMPKGKYTITVKAFYRTTDQQGNYDAYQEDKTAKAFVYCGYAKSPLLNIAEIASTDETAFDYFREIYTDNGSTLYVPNNQCAAHKVFIEDVNGITLSSVTTALAQSGSLTLGIKSEQMNSNSWVVWGDFHLYYNTTDASGLEEVAVIPIEVSTHVNDNNSYDIDEEPALDLEELENLIGTRSPTFYAWTSPNADGNSEMTDQYSCTPYPGFWMSKDGYRSTWSSSSPVGVCYLSNGHFKLYQYPGTPKNGDVWNGKFVLLNESSHQYITIDLTMKFFDSIVVPDKIEVANQTIVVNGNKTMDISLYNVDANLVAFQMDLTLPEGVSIDKEGCSLSSRITDEKQELTIGKLGDNVYRLTSSSLSLTPIDGNEGTLLTLKLNASEDAESGEALLSNIRFSTSDSKRITMSDESFNINILHKFKLTYFVDGEEYMTDSITYKTPLAPEAEPTKDGYTFGGWSEIPETMPAGDVEITGQFYLYGDVNTDEEVDVVDVVDIARFVVATPSEKFREKLADLNSDETVNLGDAVTLVNFIVGDQNFVKPMFAPANYMESIDALRLTRNGKTISLDMTNSKDYTAFQFDLYLSEDADVAQIMLNTQRKQKHQLLYNKVEDGHYRVAAFSTTNRTFQNNEGELLSFDMDGKTGKEATISNIQFFDVKGNAYLFDAIGIDTATALDSVTTINNTEAGAVFDLQGRKLSKLQRGVNIVNGKAIIIRK